MQHNLKRFSILSLSQAQRWYFVCLVYYIALLPFQVKTPPITLGIMLLGLGWLLSLRFTDKFKMLATNPAAWLSMAYMLWVVIAATYAPVPREAWKDAFTKIPFLVWPLLMGSIPALPQQYFRRLLQFFTGALVVSLITAVSLALWRYLESEKTGEFFSSRLMCWTVITPHYLGMYLNFAYGILLFYALRQKFLFHRIVHYTILGILVLGIWIMAVRIQYVLFILLSGTLLFNGLRQKTGTPFAFMASASAATALVIMALSLNPTRSRMVDTYHEIISFEHKVNNKQTNPRKFLWTGAATVIAKNPWLGNGLATGADSLQEEIEKMPQAIFWDGSKTYHLSERHYNMHNVYMQHWAEMGLPGLLLLLGFFLTPVLFRHSSFNSEARLFLLVAAVSFATESMLERQAGILFFSFFYALFFVVRWQPLPAEEAVPKKATTH